MKLVIHSSCFGGFSLSEAAYKELGMAWDGHGWTNEVDRSDPRLVACVEKLGAAAGGKYANLKIVEIPDDVDWEIEEYDCKEWVAEKHRRWD